MGKNNNNQGIGSLPEDFKNLVRSKLKNPLYLRKALKLFLSGGLSYYEIMTAEEGQIDIPKLIRESKLIKAAAEEAATEAEAKWKQRRAYFGSLDKFYSSEAAKKDIVEAGGYCVAVEEGIIVIIIHEQGGARQGGCIYENSRFGSFGNLDSCLDRIKEEYPELYQEIERFIPGTEASIREQQVPRLS